MIDFVDAKSESGIEFRKLEMVRNHLLSCARDGYPGYNCEVAVKRRAGIDYYEYTLTVSSGERDITCLLKECGGCFVRYQDNGDAIGVLDMEPVWSRIFATPAYVTQDTASAVGSVVPISLGLEEIRDGGYFILGVPGRSDVFDLRRLVGGELALVLPQPKMVGVRDRTGSGTNEYVIVDRMAA